MSGCLIWSFWSLVTPWFLHQIATWTRLMSRTTLQWLLSSFSMTNFYSPILILLHTHILLFLYVQYVFSMSNKALENYWSFFFFFIWNDSNKDRFLFDVIKLLRLDLGVRVNFFPSIVGSYQKTSNVRHSFKLHGTLFFFFPSLHLILKRQKGEAGVAFCCPTPQRQPPLA